MELVSVAAVAENGVIGRNGELPWTLPEDKRLYRERIADGTVILGRRTFESMLDDLPGRLQIVLSRTDRGYPVDTAYHAGDAHEAIALAESQGADVAYVIGGAEIYALFQPSLQRMILTRVPGIYEGDAYYPEWTPEDWTLIDETAYDGFTVQEWVRIPPEE